MSPISRTTVVSRRPHAITNDLSETETVMLDIEQGRYFGLHAVGKVVWELLESPTVVDELCQHLVTRFEVDIERCRREITVFLEGLLEHELIEVHDAETVR